MRRGGAGKRRDANEPAIIDALLKVGATVQQLGTVYVVRTPERALELIGCKARRTG